MHSDFSAGLGDASLVRQLTATLHETPALNQRSHRNIKSATRLDGEVPGVLQKIEQTGCDLYRFVCSMGVHVRNFALGTIKAELILQAVYFIQRLLARGAEMHRIVTMQGQLEPSGHRMASERDARHGARRKRRFNALSQAFRLA